MNHPTSTPIRCSSTPAIWPVLCGPNLHGANGSGIALSGAMPNSLLSFIFGNPLHEPDQTLRAFQAWPDHAAESPGDGAAHPQPRGPARHGAEPTRGRLLRPARVGRPVDHRSQPGLAAGPGLPGHTRHLFEGT